MKCDLQKNFKVFICLALIVFLVPAVATATCGGGGGGGVGGVSRKAKESKLYQTQWARSFEISLNKASKDGKAFLVYFEPKSFEDPAKEFKPFTTKMFSTLSKEFSFVKLRHQENETLRKRWKVSSSKHVIHICDSFGNSIKSFTGKSPYGQVKTVLSSADRIVKSIEKKSESLIRKAQLQIEKGNPHRAVKPLLTVLQYKGYPVVQKARKLMNRVEQVANRLVQDALSESEKSRKVKKLKLIKSRFRDLEAIIKLCDDELKTLLAAVFSETPVQTALVSLGQEESQKVIAAQSSSAPFIEEASYLALVQGIAFENSGDYQKALESYALASGLDSQDPIPLIFLGELYRHHLGLWDKAQIAFKRVLEIDRNDFAIAIAAHGLGKISIWNGDNQKGLKLFQKSIEHFPTALCYRNLAVFWNTEEDFKKAFYCATRAFELDPDDDYNKVFYSVYLQMAKQPLRAESLLQEADFDPSMSYNFACYYAYQGKNKLALEYLKRHFYEYEQYDEVRRYEMSEARMDINFANLMSDPEFLELTSLALEPPPMVTRP